MLVASVAHAQPELDKTKQSFDQSILGLFGKYCFRCHGKTDPSSEIDLQSDENPRMIADNAQLWNRVRAQLESELMPPDDERQPNEEERGLLLEFLNRTLSHDRCGGDLDPGVSGVRRLNHFEYNRCLSKLLGMPIDVANDFAPDPNSFGFLNNAAALEMDPVLVTQYYGAAEEALDRLIETGNRGHSQYAVIFGSEQRDASPERERTRTRLIEFATRAFRRPLDADDPIIDRWMEIYDAAYAQEKSHVLAMKYPLISILISPRFLVRAEADEPDESGVYRVDNYDLASRLSFFLWSEAPDETLLELARDGKLSSDQELRLQTRRMLQDEKRDGLLTGFFEQWLSIVELDAHPVDASTFPTFNDDLRDSMKEEVRQFIDEVVRENRSIHELIDADYVYVDARLAELYALPKPAENGFVKLTLADSDRAIRGGVLTSAAMLTLLSDPARTNVPKRGKFVASVLLGAPPPPPPPNVPALEATKSTDEPLTTRARLERHRSNPQCAACHAKMDPFGFALENFDAIGRWRDRENGIPIDASGTLVSGEAFDGIMGLKRVLKSHDREFAQSLTESLMIYALGRGLTADDQCAVQEILRATQPDGYRFGDIVAGAATSLPFTHRRNADF